MATDRYEREMKLVMGFIKETNPLFPSVMMDLCHTFYHKPYRWDASTIYHDRVKINAECDTIMINDSSYVCNNVFGDEILQTKQVHIINFHVYQCEFMHLGIIASDSIHKYLNQDKNAFHEDQYGWSYYSRTGALFHDGEIVARKIGYYAEEKIRMIVDLDQGKLSFTTKDGVTTETTDLDVTKQYKIAFMAWSQPNNVRVV